MTDDMAESGTRSHFQLPGHLWPFPSGPRLPTSRLLRGKLVLRFIVTLLGGHNLSQPTHHVLDSLVINFINWEFDIFYHNPMDE